MLYRKENNNKRKVRQRILILCEGETETLYLSNLKSTLPREIQRDIDINIVQSKYSEPSSTIKEIVRKRKKAKEEKQDYKECWMVFDDDNRNLTTLFKDLKKEKIKIAYNSISIEYWFLLHYERTNRHCTNNTDALHRLTTLKPDYSKTSRTLWNEFESLYQTQAKSNALWLRKHHENPEIYNAAHCKPYSNMDELIDTIRNYTGE